MTNPQSPWSAAMLDVQLDLVSNSTEVAVRSAERLWRTQVEGCQDWVQAMQTQPEPAAGKVDLHLDQGVHLGWQLFVAQVAAMTDSMHLLERAVAETQRNLLCRIDQNKTGKPALEPVRSAVCLSGTAYDSMSKATRQVANFASNRFSAAAVSAFYQAREHIAQADCGQRS